MTNKIYFLVGPSGVGKTIVRNYITSKFDNIKFIPSYTTRAPRINEINEVDYFFISKKEFQNLIQINALIEWEEHFGNLYGITKGYCENQLKNGYSLIKEIAVDGYKQILKNTTIEKGIIKSIFIYPDNINQLLKRLELRGESNIEKRIISIENELESSKECDHIIRSKNNQLPELFNEVENIINSYL